MQKLIPLFLVLFFISPSFGAEYDINFDWFKNFNDSKLEYYIQEALAENHNINKARKNILKFRQEKNLKISNEFPYASVGANYVLLKMPKLAIPNNDLQTNSFALPFMTVWEADYLGKKYDEIKKARLDLENSYWELKSMRLIVAVDLASAYFNASNLIKQIELQMKIINLKEEIYKKKKKMFNYGVISENELNEFEENFIYEKNNLDNLQKQKEEFLTQIAYLTGKSPSCTDEIEITPFEEIEYMGEYPESLNGDIVLNRPDLLKLDNEIKKAKLDITISKKDFLPNINVFGILAFSTIVQNFNWKGALGTLSAGATQTFFDGGKRIFDFKKRKAEYEVVLENYFNADLTALKELNDALYALKKDLEIYKNNNNRLKIANESFVNVFKSYNYGVKSSIDYMSEDSECIKKESEFLNSKNQNFNNLLSLYKAAGGAL